MAQDLKWYQRIFTRKKLAEPLIVPPTAQLSAAPIIRREAQGSAGSEIYSGYLAEEYLAELRGTRRAKIYDQMRRSDYQIIMLLRAVKNAIKSATYEIDSNDDSEQAEQDRLLIEQIFFKDINWSQYLNEALTCIDFGFSVFELTHKICKNPKLGTYVGIKNPGWRSPKTIERWNLNKETKELESVTQISYGDTQKMIDLDARYLSIITLDQEGQNFEGISMLRGVYGNYLRKKTYMKLNAIGIEKFAIPTPTAEIPDVDLSGEQYENLIESLENFVSHESQYLTYPQGWKVELISNTYDPQKVEYSIDAEDIRMTRAFLANFLNLGQGGSSGSYALSSDLSDFFFSGLDYIVGLCVRDINEKIIPELIQINRGPRESYPTIVHSGISDKAGKELAEILASLGANQYIIPDDALEDSLRKRYKLTKRSEEGQRKPLDKGAQSFVPFMSENKIYEQIKLAEAKRFK